MDYKGFLGKGLKFPLQIDPKTGKIAMSSHEEDIAEAIGIIIGTYQGERVMRPSFGTTVADYAFSSSGEAFADSIAYDVKRRLGSLEPRIKDIKVVCSRRGDDSGELVFDISYTVRTTNNRYNKVYPFYDNMTQ